MTYDSVSKWNDLHEWQYDRVTAPKLKQSLQRLPSQSQKSARKWLAKCHPTA